MVYVLAAGFGTVTALDNPSRQTFVMEMVGPDDVSNAVTLNSVVVNAARAVGPAIAGVAHRHASASASASSSTRSATSPWSSPCC